MSYTLLLLKEAGLFDSVAQAKFVEYSRNMRKCNILARVVNYSL